MCGQYRYGRIRSFAIYLSVLVCLMTFGNLEVPGAPGDLDPTFSGDGKLIDGSLIHSRDDANGVAIQADGKIVVAGSREWGDGGTIARYNPDGSLDATFGNGGWITSCYAADVAIQADGKIVVGCSYYSGPTSDFAIARYNPDGSLDTAFGNGGKVVTPISTGNDYIESIAIQSDGKIVAAGSVDVNPGVSDDRFAVARFNADGSLDTTFNGDGKVITLVGVYSVNADPGNSVVIQSDGKIIVAGGAYMGPLIGRDGFVLIRYNVDGSLDNAFDSDGIVTTTSFGCSGGGGYAKSVTIQEDGKIVAAGASCGFTLARYKVDGSLDSTFGGDGTVLTQAGLGLPLASVNSVAVRPDGKIVAMGTSRISLDQLDTDLAAARYNADGSLDTTFDGDGVVTTPVNTGWSQINSSALLPDGKILGVGYNSQIFGGNGGSNLDNFILARYNDNGSLDTSFDSDGMVITDFPYLSGGPFSDVAVQTDGKILAAGNYDLFRYNPDGTHDATFGGGTGRVNAGFSPIFPDHTISLAVQSDGKIVAAGTEYCGNDFDYDLRLARFNQDGSPDTSFAGDGVVFGCAEPFSGSFSSVAIQPDGKIVAAGESRVFRFNHDGSIDTTFGDGDGFVVVETAGTTFSVAAIAIGSDGKIALAGSYCPGCPNSDFMMGRLNTDGSFDTTFDGDGRLTTTLGPGDDRATSVVVQPDGRIVAAGYLSNGSNKDLAVVRYNSNGSLDTAFDSDGIVTTPIGTGDDTASSIAIDKNGKLVVAGSSGGDFALARYNPNGSLDTTLGGGDGISVVDFEISNDVARAMTLDNQGRAVVVGESNGAFAIARFRLKSNTPFDYDGDGKTDLSVYRWSNGNWYVARSMTGNISVQNFSSGRIFPADYDGDGQTDLATVASSDLVTGELVVEGEVLLVLNSATNTISSRTFPLGSSWVPADFDGDGKADLAGWTNDSGAWSIYFSSSGSGYTQQWGIPGDKPVPADFDGDGNAELAVFRPSEGKWYVLSIATGSVSVVGWGLDGDIPVPGDYNGDGRADFAVYRPSDNTWYRAYSSDGSIHINSWGLPGDLLVPGDYDGDGSNDLAVFRPSDSTWYLANATSGAIYIQSFGLAGDLPTPSAFVY